MFTENEIQEILENAKQINIVWKKFGNRTIRVINKQGEITEYEFKQSTNYGNSQKNASLEEDRKAFQDFRTEIEDHAKSLGIIKVTERGKNYSRTEIETYHFVGDEPKKLSDAQSRMLKDLLRKEQLAAVHGREFHGISKRDFPKSTINKMVSYGYIIEGQSNYWLRLSESGKARALKEFPELTIENMKHAAVDAEIEKNKLLNLKQSYINKMSELLPEHCSPMIEIKSNNEAFFANPTAYTFTFTFTVDAVIKVDAIIKVDYSSWNRHWDVKIEGEKAAHRSIEINSSNLAAYIEALQMAQDVTKTLNTMGHIEI